MSEETEEEQEEPKKRSKLPLILALVLALGGGGGAFFAIYSGMILGGGHEDAAAADQEPHEEFVAPDVAFVPLEPMVITMGAATENKHLRFTANLEVPSHQVENVTAVTPRVLDVLNNYLRALRMEDFEDPAALVRIRAQMLRRIQVITGPEAVRDLLITEFVMT